MSDVVDAVAMVQIEVDRVIQYRADCGVCKQRLWRTASFCTFKVDYIACEQCKTMNIVRRPW